MSRPKNKDRKETGDAQGWFLLSTTIGRLIDKIKAIQDLDRRLDKLEVELTHSMIAVSGAPDVVRIQKEIIEVQEALGRLRGEEV